MRTSFVPEHLRVRLHTMKWTVYKQIEADCIQGTAGLGLKTRKAVLE
jgi:hypothetical protein